MQPDILNNLIEVILKTYWPWLILFAVIYIIKELGPDFLALWKRKSKFSNGERWRSGRELILWLQRMNPKEFEQYVTHLFNSLGYNAETVGGAYDGGIDVIAIKNGTKHYIQCKKYITSKVPVGAVRDFYGAMADRGAQAKGIFITTNVFTLEAERFAEGKPLLYPKTLVLSRLFLSKD